jgi:hypothetical protein
MPLPGLLNLFGYRPAVSRLDLPTADQDRIANYTRYRKAYGGWTLKEYFHTTNRDLLHLETSYKKLKHNFNAPVVNLSAAFLAGIPLDWEVKENPKATADAYDIWGRSDNFLEAAKSAAIDGDLVCIATVDPESQLPRIEFVTADICFPTFDGKSFDRLRELDISYQVEDREGRLVLHREFYTEQGYTIYEDDRVVQEVATRQMPAAWVRNMGIKGQPFGISDVGRVIDLVDEYDHIDGKQTRILDYYASPNIVWKGVQKGNLQKDTHTMYFIPPDADAFFLEWKGGGPAAEDQLTRLRNDIAEISQVPAIAFGRIDPVSNISGVAIRLLYGPLINKTTDNQGNWEPALKCTMAQCLQALGHEVTAADINVVWPNNIPVSGNEKVAEESAAVASGIRSLRTAMNNLGVENPDAELKRIFTEKALAAMLAQMTTGMPAADPIKVAAAAGKQAPVSVGGRHRERGSCRRDEYRRCRAARHRGPDGGVRPDRASRGCEYPAVGKLTTQPPTNLFEARAERPCFSFLPGRRRTQSRGRLTVKASTHVDESTQPD